MGRHAVVRAPARAGTTTTDDPGFRARALAGLFAAGATLALLTLVLPHSPRADETALGVIIAGAYVIAGLLHRLGARVPPRLLRYLLGLGSFLITLGAFFSADNPSPLIFFYLWVFLYASYFFTRRETVAQVLFVGVAYGGLLVVAPPPTGVAAWWAVGMGTLLVAAALVTALRDRSEMLIAQLYDAARTDPLTEMRNRRGFREGLDLELERARRNDAPVTLLAGDLDRFKEVNDRSGHHVGDAVLRRTARILEEGTRTIDVTARVGGEEFALVLPGTDHRQAMVIAERLRCQLQSEFASQTVPVTICFGIASFPAHGETAAALLRAGDDALYAAKAGGRNRSVVHSPELRNLANRGDDAVSLAGERYLGVVLDLAEAADLRFSGSARHSETVGRYAEMMGEALGLPAQRVQRLRLAGVLHDVGKVALPDAILHKPSALTDDEWTVIRRHPQLGAQVLDHPALEDIRDWVGAHHERPDGQGYPSGLAGAAVPLEARILAVADAYEAMTSDRPYRAALGHAAARAELQRHAGGQFDPLVVRALIGVLERESSRAEALAPAG